MTRTKVAIVGGSGFLGSSLVRAFERSGRIEPIVLKRATSSMSRLGDLVDRVRSYDIGMDNAEKLLAHIRPESVLYAATNYGRNAETTAEVYAANRDLPLAILAAARNTGVSSFLWCGTPLPASLNAYAASKQEFAQSLRDDKSHVKKVDVVLEHFFGPGDDERKFVTRLVRSLLRNEPKIPLTAGEQKRDLVYIDDVVSAFVTIVEHLDRLPASYSPLNVCTGAPLRLREFVEMVKSEVPESTTELLFGSLPYRSDEPMDSNLDFERMRQLGWSPSTPVRMGIRALIEYERALIT